MDEINNILVVDDEKVVREGCKRVLTGKGFEVFMAENGQQAMDMLDETVDLMLLDLKMPVMGGEQVLEKTNALFPDVPVIIITGHGTIDTAVECMKQGAYDFITKPFEKEVLLQVVQKALERSRLLRENLSLKRKIGAQAALSSFVGQSAPLFPQRGPTTWNLALRIHARQV